MKKFAILLAALAAAAIAPSAWAQFAKPDKAIEYRQAAFTVMAQHFGSLGAMANGKAPFDAKVAADDADVLAVVDRLPFTAFGPGTDKGNNTKAKPDIWQKTDDFNQHADKMKTAMANLVTAARSGNLDAIKKAFGPTAQTCKGCHDSYKEK
ncbi:MAG: cytochrome c [Burkholderiaceae bacterium]|jgi:cytochrome c556|nr:cytochrome c [Burkholderiaceae bacterium]